jgi:predicted aspartyl protease
MYLGLSWRETDQDAVTRVGLFRLDLPGLLKERYIRWEPKDSSGPEVRVRVIRTGDGHFYLQVNQDGPRVLMM